MIKGIQKNIIVIKDPGSHIFEQAIFIVKKDLPHLSDITLRYEDEKIIQDQTSALSEPKRKKTGLFLSKRKTGGI